MASAHHAGRHSAYSLPPPPPPPNAQNDFRLPSLKDLNFSYRPPQELSPPSSSSGPLEPSSVTASQDHAYRPSQPWARASQPVATMPVHQPHQQHTPPLSAGHEISAPRSEYPTKHDNAGYLTPGLPLSAQMTPVQGSLNLGSGPRGEEMSQVHAQHRRRPSATNSGISRETRPAQLSYPPQYASYPPSQPPPTSPVYQQVPSGHPPPPMSAPGHPPVHPPPMHDQMAPHPSPVTPTHPGYGAYQHQYMQPRPHHVHQQHSPHQPPPGNPYPSPATPASAPQDPWQHHSQSHSQHQPHQSHQPQPPPPHSHHISHPQPPQHIQHPQHPQHQHPPPHPPTDHTQHPPQPQHIQHASHPAHHPQHPQHPAHPPHPPHPQSHHTQPPPSSQPTPHHTQHTQLPPPPQHSQLPPPTQHAQHPVPPHSQLPPVTPHHQQIPTQPPPPQPQPAPLHHQTLPPYQQPPPSQHPPPAPVQPQHSSQLPFGRTTALVPTTVDTRASFSSTDSDKPSPRDSTMSEIIRHCNVLYEFASRYAQLTASLHVQPSTAEYVEMTQRAKQVVHLLEELKGLSLPESERMKLDSASITDEHRPPKRPWEDMARSGTGPDPASFSEFPASADKAQSTAEQDMEIIRTKRATSTAGGAASAGQPKSKYRKRSRATPPGKCHSCNIRETPEWRRGPDGARTLCNACGLHYAKLMRKREKMHGANSDAPRIDMETLRASARASESGEKSRSKHNSQANQGNESSPGDNAKQQQMVNQQSSQHHQGTFQVMHVMPPTPTSNHATPMAGRMQSEQAQAAQQVIPPPSAESMQPPPPPWAVSAPQTRSYAPDQFQHQSFMRTSQHVSSNHTSPR